MKIMGPPSATYDSVIAKLRARGATVHPRFITDMVPALWAAGLEYGIDPVGMVAQSAKETNWGNFTGKVPWQFYNTAGNKISPAVQPLFPGTTDGDNPLAHAQFASWKVGATVQAQHLRRYAGVPLGVETLLLAPRYWAVSPANTGVTDWAGLGGKWAPAANYGTTLETIMASLQ